MPKHKWCTVWYKLDKNWIFFCIGEFSKAVLVISHTWNMANFISKIMIKLQNQTEV